MGCNCAASREVDAIVRRFGHNLEEDKSTKHYTLKKVIYTLGVYIAMIPISFYLIYYILNNHRTKDKIINISEVLRLKKKENV